MSDKMNIQVWDIDRLVPYEKNAKVHTPEQVSKIAESIRQFNWTQPIVVDRNGVIINGHGRRQAALSLGLTKVPVWVRDDLNEDEVKAARLADNRVAIGDYDMDLLQEELANLDYDLKGIFDDKELTFMVTADLGEMNVDAFIDDVDAEVDAQQREMHDKIDASKVRKVPLYKAMGFKDVTGDEEFYVSRFMAMIEAQFNCGPQEAFAAFTKNFCLEDKS